MADHQPVPLQATAHAERELLARTPDVIAPGHTFETVTETISHVVMSKRTPLGWFLGFGIAFMLLMILNLTIGKLLPLDGTALARARQELIRAGWIAYEKPLYQVLSLDPTGPTSPPAAMRAGEVQSIAQILTQALKRDQV